MDKERRHGENQDSDWIFATDDPHTLPTERLPDRAEFDRYSAPLLARRRSAALPPGENETVDLSGLDPEQLRAGTEPDAATGAIPAIDPDAEEDAVPTTVTVPEESVGPSTTAPLRAPRDVTYARSGTTPNAEDEDAPATGLNGFVLPERFKDLGIFDALRDVMALICMVAAMTTTFTVAHSTLVDGVGKIVIGVGLAALVAVHLMRWIPSTPPLPAIRVVRVAGLAPALLVAVGTVVSDLVGSLPVLFSSLPDGPPVGLGVGVSLLLLGAILGIEPRAHEGYLPQARARRVARILLVAVGIAAAAALLLALVMIIGRLFTTGWSYSLLVIGDTVISALLLGIVLASALLRERSWYVFSTAAVSSLAVAALADNTLQLQFAAPLSFATDYVYLPFLFAALGLMISRSFVRTMPIAFQRTDWLVFTVRAFEFSALLHTAAVLWHVLAAVVATSGRIQGSPVLHLIDAAVCLCFVAVSLFARTSLLSRPAVTARANGVIAGLLMVVVGFLDVIVNSLATGAGAGLVTGGTALTVGIAAALMLTVPAPVRDEFGAPDIVRMFADFRARDSGSVSLLSQVPDVTEETARKKAFPGR
ncbi:hypothetical protein [Brachybacterium alimentarium]|uniref:DUF7937 domain-containing protein n=1 Tax=Brachybacterium alimentarium TaxID=47845 RepID=UPI000DF35578|nr:hypothetical protein [Brachybacterium alimentarium]RCS67307.1 hypothetical protein CIK73_10870 [Brachybacterium alimentarium]RCS71238.1 hypothetical protein CIK68_09535 [Brachybacterium alimentarium]RCS77184.1 hypothetical protein CIK72_14835 [Brachybacterium alimentarium]